jgi:hypothetical protein
MIKKVGEFLEFKIKNYSDEEMMAYMKDEVDAIDGEGKDGEPPVSIRKRPHLLTAYYMPVALIPTIIGITPVVEEVLTPESIKTDSYDLKVADATVIAFKDRSLLVEHNVKDVLEVIHKYR